MKIVYDEHGKMRFEYQAGYRGPYPANPLAETDSDVLCRVVVAHVVATEESRDLLVRGVCGLYWLSARGRLTPIDGELVAVAVAGRPKAPGLQDGRTLEITRVCTLGHENACSRLYGALCRAAKALGWLRVYTYTLESEPGTSLRAAGFVVDAVIEERDWAERSGRDRYHENLLGERTTPAGPKVRWKRSLNAVVAA